MSDGVRTWRDVAFDWVRAGPVGPEARVRIDWLVSMLEHTLAEVDRLRGLLARLEWAGLRCEEHIPGGEAVCPVCDMNQEGHTDDCWLGAELGRT
jgi:hypothetical protein